jgi:glycosyltransferase involved in cell wall biosynthesis
MPTISIIMNCFNCGKYLREALDSAFAQTYKDFEVIFWDNLSSDSSIEIAKQYPIRFFSNTHLLPLGESRNLAIKQAAGKYIAFLDCDDVWLPTKLEKQVALLESNPELALVYADCYHINAGGKVLLQSFRASSPHWGYIFNDLFAHNFIPMVTVMARKDMMPAFSYGFDIAEEYDIWLKLAATHPFDFVNEPLAKYRVYPENTSSTRCEQAVREDRIIIDYWLERKPWLKSIARKKLVLLSAVLARHYYRNRQVRKLLTECFNLIRMLPDSLMLIKKIPYVMR